VNWWAYWHFVPASGAVAPAVLADGMHVCIRNVITLVAALAAGCSPARAAGDTYADGPAPDELTLSGAFAGIAPGEKLVVKRSELRALSGVRHRREHPVPPLPEADLEQLPFSALLAAHPLAPGANMLVLRSNDRWKSFWTSAFIASHQPWLLLAIDNKTPAEGWPRIADHEEALAPYHAGVSKADAPPGWDGYTPAHAMADATQVVEITAVNEAEYFAPFFSGALASPSPQVAEGRRLFMANCITCHQGPGGVGGNLSRRPFMILQMHATHNADYLRKFITNPRQFMPATIMPPHPKFGDKEHAALRAFLSALPPEPPPAP
jgi:mono/diheme cytochrome c family protein